jgi:hypothetical protein
VPNSIPTRALPGASAAGVAVLVAGTIASQVGAGAAVAAHPAAPSTAFSTKNMPTAVQKALKAQFESITKNNSKRVTPKAAPAAVTPAKATKSATKADGFSFQDASYILTMRSAGIEYIDDIPRELQQDQGFSYVDLLHDIGQPQGRCETFGGAYWLGQEVEEGVLGKGAAPPDAGDVSGGYKNPFVSRDVEPNLSAGENQSNRSPGIPNYFPPGNTVVPMSPGGPGYNWTAKCDDDTHGRGQGDTFNIGGFQVIGSTSSAGLDKSTGVYTGTSRAYFAGLDGATKYDGGSSFMQVTNANGSDAKISYRMSYFNSGDKTGTNGISFGGQDIPAQQFADAFNSGAKSFGAAASAIGPMGAATLEPEVGTSTDGGRYSITISAGHGNLGFAARSGTVGQNQEMRIGSVTWQGVYGSNN